MIFTGSTSSCVYVLCVWLNDRLGCVYAWQAFGRLQAAVLNRRCFKKVFGLSTVQTMHAADVYVCLSCLLVFCTLSCRLSVCLSCCLMSGRLSYLYGWLLFLSVCLPCLICLSVFFAWLSWLTVVSCMSVLSGCMSAQDKSRHWGTSLGPLS